MTAKLLVVGGGRMGGALLAGLVKSGWAKPQELAVLEPDPERGASLSSTHGGLNVLSQAEPGVVGEDGGAVLAVKPDVAASACRSIALSGAKRVLSIVAGLPTDRMEGWLPEGTVVVRAMPNTAVLVGAGVSAVSGGSRAKANDLAWAEDILSAVGTVIRLPESLLDSVTGLSGSGPAYVFFIAEAMIEAGVISGLTREVSRTLVVE